MLRYTFSAGSWTLAATVAGFTNPIGLAVSTDGNNTLMVADGEQSGVAVDQQIKAYNNAGTAQWTLGQAGGYATNGPAVTNDKFILDGMICPQPDGSFWITDFGGGNRTMRFDSYANGLGFISDITYATSYSATIDQNNPADVFQTILGKSFVEYQINYSEPFTENLGWTPVDNWTYLGNTNLMTTSMDTTFAGLNAVATLGNGRTYALLETYLVTGNSSDYHKYNIVELTSAGLRNTGYQTPGNNAYDWLGADGSLTSSAISGGVDTFYKVALTGNKFDSSNNPIYGAAVAVASVPWSETWDNRPPAPRGLYDYAPWYVPMSNGMLAVYNQAPQSAGMHLGVINPATNSYQWQAMPAAGPFDGQGNYDTWTWYGGNLVMVSGSNIFVGYNGEGWTDGGPEYLGQGQANQFMQFNSDGLFIGEFGSPQLVNGSEAATYANGYGVGGNSMSPFVVQVNGTIYLYENDEGHRSLMRWHLTGENSIEEQSQSVVVGAPPRRPA